MIHFFRLKRTTLSAMAVRRVALATGEHLVPIFNRCDYSKDWFEPAMTYTRMLEPEWLIWDSEDTQPFCESTGGAFMHARSLQARGRHDIVYHDASSEGIDPVGAHLARLLCEAANRAEAA